MFYRSPRKVIAGWLALFVSQLAFAAEIIHQPPSDFLAENLPSCQQKALWLKSDMKKEVESLLGHPFTGARVRYCMAEGKTGWILDEIGKTEPITTGVVVHDGVIEQVRVLVFRESRGGEVHREVFTRQYEQAVLDGKRRLDRNIDGITGATMSVSAVNRQVRLALLLDGYVREAMRDG
jgi:hypothetical protein